MIFVDTGAFLAKYLERDQYHREAARIWDKLQKNQIRCLTSNFVLDETFTFLARRSGNLFAAERARRIFSSTSITILRPTPEDEYEAIELFEKYADQEVSLTDCVSFALMRKHHLKEVFTFDKHFEIAGFQISGN